MVLMRGHNIMFLMKTKGKKSAGACASSVYSLPYNRAKPESSMTVSNVKAAEL